MRTCHLRRLVYVWACLAALILAPAFTPTAALDQPSSSTSKSEAKPKAKSESKAKPDNKAKPESKSKAEAKSKAKTESKKSDPDESKPDPDASAKAIQATESKPPKPPAKRVPLRIRSDFRVAARVYGEKQGKVTVELPDGRLGQIEGEVRYTEDPFVVWSKDQIRDELLKEPGLANFRSRTTDHYVLVYDASDKFVENSANLLESLYLGLTQTLKQWGLEIRESEFPLVAIVYAEEQDFRRRMQVAPEVQAYYEIMTNRIVFYENSERNKANPEIAEMRKPQTVAHEGAHQILQNIGVQPRLAPWPLWLVEGMAELCAPTTTKKNAEWAGVGRVNAIHMATIRDLNDPISQRLRSLGAEPRPVERAPNMTLVEHLVRRTSLNPTEYALCWAQTHYLATKKKPEFREYLKKMASLEPLDEKTPDQQWELFRTMFPRDPVRFDRDVAKHLDSLKNYEALPYFAVLFEHPIPGGVRRAAFVSQSPSIIQQNLNQVRQQLNGLVNWRAIPCSTRAKADLLAKQLLQGGL